MASQQKLETVGRSPTILLDKWAVNHHHDNMKTLAETILEDVEAFMITHDVAPTTFGKLTINDGHLVFDLRRKRNVTIGKLDRVRQFMHDYRPTQRKTRKRCPHCQCRQRSTVSA